MASAILDSRAQGRSSPGWVHANLHCRRRRIGAQFSARVPAADDKGCRIKEASERLVTHRAPHSRLNVLAVSKVVRIANQFRPRREASRVGVIVVEDRACGLARARYRNAVEISTAEDQIGGTVPITAKHLASAERN